MHRLWSIGLVLLLGCSQSSGPKETPEPGELDKFKLDAEPPGVKSVIEARKETREGDEVVLAGQIGGQSKPFTSGRAAFHMVDLDLKPCEGDCAWDFCEEQDRLPSARVYVRFTDDAGKTLGGDVRKAFGVKELSRVVVKGKIKRDDRGNFELHARGLYVRQE